MRQFLTGRGTVCISTSDAAGVCHASFQAGAPGFVRVLDDRTVMYPVYPGAGVAVSLRDIAQNPHVGLLCVDLPHGGASLHVSGRARLVEHTAVEAFAPLLRRMSGIEHIEDVVGGRRQTPERWVLVDIVEARIDFHEPAVAPATVPTPLPAAAPAPVAAVPPAVAGGGRRPPTGFAVDDDELSYLLPPAWEEAAPR